MTIYFSAATCSFYNTDVFPENNLPEDCVIVEEETYKNLMEQQNAGFVIVPDSDGNPSVMPQNCGACHCTVYVDKTSNETISGVKTFTDTPLVPTPAEDASGQEVVNAEWVKANGLDLSSLTTVHCVVDTYKNGSSWYRVYDDGWIEQGGSLTSSTLETTVSFLKTFNDTDYTLTLGGGDHDSDASILAWACKSKSTTGFVVKSGYNGTFYSGAVNWFACGYGA